ncbi:exodeoxyribonuclease VII large subunit [Bacillus paralicheniformis]|uniref:exodeoxyribonuclease VII large subunit n=1 Tax=Bacillus paralicheniformis TaxID=1648923 RepID=UPI000D03E684|nr:exodeoxyribonuclease VII large subunit [Bacillus paralicheniformis]KAA0836481.1 exodeoxyribonuclease VII large subunit [Bacillus paralicheniformis]KAA0843579.1 exodeoxyribonuclease VII large subunit [Bacillus paralicheniformis]MED1126911.1 exodeoxyribonuclease VII large subunit [Bacillus paralicheniformis]TWK45778.1 Exodeoxyribonuclease 7 large subunit [Bacillus paralicheniformis]WEA69997.1 exodeoxyribonuclease VII large subunit [Bacillus paralicheniformis]
MSEISFVTVTALTKYIKRKFDVDPHLEDIWIKGELSNVKIHSRGHIYFTLKDDNARIQSVMFARQNRNLAFTPENGMKVLVRGGISVYEPSGNYQLYAKEIQPDGIGALHLAYEELKKKLSQEGLFDEKHKKPIPAFPSVVGVVTSPTGAAVRDVITTIKRRYPLVKVIVFPTLVQGVNAGESIVSSIKEANRRELCDVLIVGRGGGSIEELWAFNEEAVARAIFSSDIPIISAVGHETDFTISDFVADLRAATPTGAAEQAVPNMIDLLERLKTLEARIAKSMKQDLRKRQERVKTLQSSYAFRYPKRLYAQKEQEFDLIFDRFQKQLAMTVERKKQKLNEQTYKLEMLHPEEQLKQARKRHEEQTVRLKRNMDVQLKQIHSQFQTVLGKLNALSPLQVMERGYSLTYKENELIKSIEQVHEKDEIRVTLNDGTLTCEVLQKRGETNG